MATLLVQKFAHPVPEGSPQAAALFSAFDVIAAQADGWRWGDQELANPWFRMLCWEDAPLAEAQALLSPQPATASNNGEPLTHAQPRNSYLALNDPRLSEKFRHWWADDTRAVPVYDMVGEPGMADLVTLRAPVPVADQPPPATLSGITP